MQDRGSTLWLKDRLPSALSLGLRTSLKLRVSVGTVFLGFRAMVSFGPSTANDFDQPGCHLYPPEEDLERTRF